METKKIIKSHDVEFLEHKNVYEHLEMCPSGSNGVFVDTSLNSSKKQGDEDNEDDEDEKPKKVERMKAPTIARTNNERNEDVKD